MNDCSGTGEASVSSCGDQTAPCKETAKKKRILPGMPDPDAEVVALSPKTLFATNRFVCEICNKRFQRDQNLRLHRRGHNLPWKLRQRTSNEVKKRVYVYPEPTCVCGTKEYKCDCGTMFQGGIALSHTGHFVIAKNSEKAQSAVTTRIADEDHKVQAVVSSTPTPPTPPTPAPASEPPAVPSPAAPEPLPPPVTLSSTDSPIQNPELVERPRTNSTGAINYQTGYGRNNS